MNDLISRQAAIKAICEHGTELERRGITVLAVANHKQVTVDLLENLPSADRRGRWIYKEAYKDAHFGYFVCSLCGEAYWKPSANYCPNCGARMEGEEE